jgi:hypothetical protein
MPPFGQASAAAICFQSSRRETGKASMHEAHATIGLHFLLPQQGQSSIYMYSWYYVRIPNNGMPNVGMPNNGMPNSALMQEYQTTECRMPKK